MSDIVIDTIKLMPADGQEYDALIDIAKQSKTLSDLMKEAAVGAPISLPHIPAETLRKVIEFCTHDRDEPEPKPVEEDPALKLDDPGHVLDKPYPLTAWDQAFLAPLDQAAVFELILAANYLHVERLVKVCARQCAINFTGKTPREIYAAFGVDADLTPEEEAEVIKENPWLADK